MKYQNKDLLSPPTLDLIKDYLGRRHSIVAKAEEIYAYWSAKDWKTKKGKEVQSLEVAIDVYNSIAVDKIRRIEKQNSTLKTPKSSKKKTKANKSLLERSSLRLLRNCNDEQKKRNSNDVYLRYYDQLEDHRWLAFRKFVFAVRGRKCEICGCDKTLQIHHPQYIRGKKAWEYSCNEVIVVCRECHSKIHSK